MFDLKKCDSFITKCYNFEKLAVALGAEAEPKLNKSSINRVQAVNPALFRLPHCHWLKGIKCDILVYTSLVGSCTYATGWAVAACLSWRAYLITGFKNYHFQIFSNLFLNRYVFLRP